VPEVTESFLDGAQYTRASIEAYEAVFGPDFLSPGGRDTATALIRRLALEPGRRVLDVGCGLGGSAFLMAREFGLRVDGIDLSRNMIAMAKERLAANGLAESVSLEHGDCLSLGRPGRYDAIYSRDVFLHIHDKTRLFEVLAACLRPGATLLFTDYCCCPRPWSKAFAAYVEERSYCLQTVDEYAALLEAAGFTGISAEDRTAEFVDILHRELAAMPERGLEPALLDELRASWQQKIDRATRGEQRWGLLAARR
jgi:phosphoethanolamine N-methyltransferase